MTPSKKNAEPRRMWPGRKQRRNPWYGIGISLVSLALIVTVFIMNGAQPQVTAITTASALDEGYEPVEPTETFKPEDTFFVSVKIANYREGQEIKARWRFHGDDIGLTPLQSLKASGAITAGFVLSRQEPWPEGKYSVDILYGDTVLSSATFQVEQPRS